jgi:hypothetical protein
MSQIPLYQQEVLANSTLENNFDDKLALMAMLCALPRNEYGNFVLSLMHTKDLSCKNVEAVFQVEQTERNTLRGPLYTLAGNTALRTQDMRRGNCPAPSGTPTTPGKGCGFCEALNHKEASCWAQERAADATHACTKELQEERLKNKKAGCASCPRPLWTPSRLGSVVLRMQSLSQRCLNTRRWRTTQTMLEELQGGFPALLMLDWTQDTPGKALLVPRCLRHPTLRTLNPLPRLYLLRCTRHCVPLFALLCPQHCALLAARSKLQPVIAGPPLLHLHPLRLHQSCVAARTLERVSRLIPLARQRSICTRDAHLPFAFPRIARRTCALDLRSLPMPLLPSFPMSRRSLTMRWGPHKLQPSLIWTSIRSTRLLRLWTSSTS